uniref:Uncharacterized protein n=1 Tax=Meloidogyne incognita TaxID=6306 RepID=A0A914LFU6_MELIC
MYNYRRHGYGPEYSVRNRWARIFCPNIYGPDPNIYGPNIYGPEYSVRNRQTGTLTLFNVLTRNMGDFLHQQVRSINAADSWAYTIKSTKKVKYNNPTLFEVAIS